MIDDFKHKGLRAKMIEDLKKKGILNEVVLQAIHKIPRHFFIQDNTFLRYAYSTDEAFPIGAGQTISRPHTVAFQTDLLQVKKGDKILEIGTGSGYQTAVLCELGAKVFSIERQKELFDKTKILLEKMGYVCKLFYGDGYTGQPSFAPFDKIIVTCGAPFIPDALLNQLKIGGLMVIPVGNGPKQEMTVIKKIKEHEFEKINFGEFRFVPMLNEKN